MRPQAGAHRFLFAILERRGLLRSADSSGQLLGLIWRDYGIY